MTRFNFVAKKLYRRLIQLGGKSILPLGLADEQHEFGYVCIGIFDNYMMGFVGRCFSAVNEWIRQLWSTLLSLHPPSEGEQIISDFDLYDAE